MYSFNRNLPLDPYELHKRLINHYVLNKKGATTLLKRDTSRDKRDIDVIRENHKFIWEEGDEPLTWEERLAKKYYDKLFKEYCICDLSRYKENKIAMRWQTEPEMILGKGQFTCGAKNCLKQEKLRTWEVNFAYVEHNFKKNTLVKLRLCPDCSVKLNYKTKKKELKRGKRKKIKQKLFNRDSSDIKTSVSATTDSSHENSLPSASSLPEEGDTTIWKAPLEIETEVSREDEFQQYLEELLL